MNKQIPIFYACDEKFVNYTLVSIKSLICNSSKSHQYKIYILNTDITEETKKITYTLKQDNVDIEFVDVKEYLKKELDNLPIRDYYTKTTYFRLFIADMFKDLDKAIYIDSDTIVLKDIALMYEHDLKDYYVGAVNEQVMIQEEVYGKYVEHVCGISRYNFFNAGILLINCHQFREKKILEEFISLLSQYAFVVTQDEDYLNVICENNVLWLEPIWNVEVFKDLPVKEEDIGIIHYIMVSKPWHFEDCRLKEYFWKYASMVPVYDQIKETLKNYTDEQRQEDLESCTRLYNLAIEETNKLDSYIKLKFQGKSIDRILIEKKIALYEKEGKFDIDVEDDPASRMLMPDEVDYLRKKFSSKLKAKISFFLAKKFLYKLIKNKQFILDRIEGIENFSSLDTGAVITCNHFNALDSFAIELAYRASNQAKKKRRFYRVIREGNYTSFPGFYGMLMRNCYTLPLSSNFETMKKFISSTNQLLQEKNYVLFYPEQSMWWNYKKPKLLKDGAFKFASKNNVPVLPCFITMEDSDIKGDDGYFIQRYTIHISKPIYPLKDKSVQENIAYMRDTNYQIWKDIYEETYKIDLKYKD